MVHQIITHRVFYWPRNAIAKTFSSCFNVDLKFDVYSENELEKNHVIFKETGWRLHRGNSDIFGFLNALKTICNFTYTSILKYSQYNETFLYFSNTYLNYQYKFYMISILNKDK